MLARLDKVVGTDRSFVNYSGTLIRVSLRAEADLEKVLDDVARVLNDEAEDGSVMRLPAADATRALQGEEWRDITRVRELTAIESRTLIVRGALVLLAIVGSVGTWIAWRRRRARQRLAYSRLFGSEQK